MQPFQDRYLDFEKAFSVRPSDGRLIIASRDRLAMQVWLYTHHGYDLLSAAPFDAEAFDQLFFLAKTGCTAEACRIYLVTKEFLLAHVLLVDVMEGDRLVDTEIFLADAVELPIELREAQRFADELVSEPR